MRAGRERLPLREQDAGSAMTEDDMVAYREQVEQDGRGLTNKQARKALYTIRMLLRLRAGRGRRTET